MDVGGSYKLYSKGKATLSGGGLFRLIGSQIEAGHPMHGSARIVGLDTNTGFGRCNNQVVADGNVNGLPLVAHSALTHKGQMRARRQLRKHETGQTLVKGVNIALRDFRSTGAGTMTIADGSTIGVYGENRNDSRILIDSASKPTTLTDADQRWQRRDPRRLRHARRHSRRRRQARPSARRQRPLDAERRHHRQRPAAPGSAARARRGAHTPRHRPTGFVKVGQPVQRVEQRITVLDRPRTALRMGHHAVPGGNDLAVLRPVGDTSPA